MRNKFLILTFGLLLAVGWTSSAQAQKLAKPTIPENLRHSVQKESATSRIPDAFGANGSMRAPQRTPNTITADEVRTGEWWSSKTYTWYDTYPSSGTGHTASFTEPATDPYQMMYMVREIYTNPLYPGIQYDEVYQSATPYPGIGHGWEIPGSFDFDNIEIYLSDRYAYVTAIIVTDENDNELTEWYSNDDLPTYWSSTSTLRSTTYNDGTNNYYASYMYNGGTITIPKRLFSSASTIYIYVYAATSSSSYIGINGLYGYLSSTWTRYSLSYTSEIDNPPSYNGYTVMLVKVKDDATDFPYITSTGQDLIDGCFSKYESIEMLTDGLRVGEGTSNAGTVFAYTGDLNRFFFIGKGKTAQFSVVAPFYEMYEEFSPTTVDEGAEITDFYEKMKQGETYNIIHDCQSVSQMEHYFSMSGKAGTTENRVNSLVLYIPDDRSKSPSDGYVYRDYDHQPTVGMYMVDLYADIEPSTTPDYYTVTVEWFDNLDDLTQDPNIPQTYYLYQIMYNEQTGKNDTTLIYTGPNATWSGDYPVGDPTAYDIAYFVIATPTNATNQDTFFAKSNTDDVTVPGTTDFIGLQWWRYESDYVTDNGTDIHEVNYYRNFLAPHMLGTGNQAGISAGNVGANGRTLTLYREDIPVIDLELVMSGNKCYYRIKYRDAQNNQQIEPGYNENGELNTNN